MLNDNLPIALYQQLVREFTAKIRNNDWPVGCMLPGEMQLCQEYNVSRSTVRQAMDVLVRNGLVTRKQGRGTFVSMPKLEQNLVKFYSFSEEIKRMGYTPSSSIVSFRKLPADADMAARLSIEPNTEIFALRRLRLADGKPFALETSYIPAALYPFMTEEMIREKGLYQTMRQNSSFQPDTAVETFQAILISKADAKLLNVSCPAAGLNVTRVTSSGGVIVEICESIVLGDRYQYTVALRSSISTAAASCQRPRRSSFFICRPGPSCPSGPRARSSCFPDAMARYGYAALLNPRLPPR